jgi:uncharacterized Fe-S center protein
LYGTEGLMKVIVRALLCVTVFAAVAFSQVDTAKVPVRVTNVNATVVIEPPSSAAGPGATGNVTANVTDTLVILLKQGVSVQYGSQARGGVSLASVSYGRGGVSLELHPQSYRKADIGLFSVNGKRILRGKASVLDAGEKSISRRNIARGAYLLSVKGVDGNTFSSRIIHNGGRLDIGVVFKGDGVSSSPLGKRAAEGDWTITASAPGYLDSTRSFVPVAGTANARQSFTLREDPSIPDGTPKVYFTSKVSAAGLMTVYNALGVTPTGNKVAVKVHTGEPGPANSNKHYLKADLIQDFIRGINGTIVECNVAYGGQRASASTHYQVARDHGFSAIADVVIMDENGSDSLLIPNGTYIKKNYVGKHFKEYDFHVVLSHFKGHTLGGYGGALKNLSIGYASLEGKNYIHTAGAQKTSFLNFNYDAIQDRFLTSMAEAAKSVVDYARNEKNGILFINVMNNISVDCDCFAEPAKPTIDDIGILASLDPVALDWACYTLVSATGVSGNSSLLQRINNKNGLLTISHAEQIGLGSKTYQFIDLSNQ